MWFQLNLRLTATYSIKQKENRPIRVPTKCLSGSRFTACSSSLIHIHPMHILTYLPGDSTLVHPSFSEIPVETSLL